MENHGIFEGHIGQPSSCELSCSAHRKLGRRSFLEQASVLAAVGVTTLFSSGATTRSPHRPSTSRASRKEAVKAIPLQNLNDPLRSKIEAVVTRPTIYRRMPIEVVACDPELYLFLIRHPEVIVNMWQLMGVTRVDIERLGAYSFNASDGAGTTAKAELVFGTREKHIVLAEGAYDGPLLPRKVSGRCVLLLCSGYSKDSDGRPYVSSRLDAFVQLDNVGVEVVAKVLHPLMGRTADTNFAESTKFLGQVSHAVESNGQGIQRLVSRLDQVKPTVRDNFAKLAAKINHRTIVQEMLREETSPSARVSDVSDEQSLDRIVDR